MKNLYGDHLESVQSLGDKCPLGRSEIVKGQGCYHLENARYVVDIESGTLKITERGKGSRKYKLSELHSKILPYDSHQGLCQGGGALVGDSLIFTSGRLLIKLKLE
jgi:hypothetical protein